MVWANACTGWLGALVWVAVGFFVLGRAHRMAGMLVGGAGLLKLVANCCMVVPGLMFQAGMWEMAESLGALPGALAGFMRSLVFALIIAGFVVGAKELARQSSEPSS